VHKAIRKEVIRGNDDNKEEEFTLKKKKHKSVEEYTRDKKIFNKI
jgi:hypothetical protein